MSYNQNYTFIFTPVDFMALAKGYSSEGYITDEVDNTYAISSIQISHDGAWVNDMNLDQGRNVQIFKSDNPLSIMEYLAPSTDPFLISSPESASWLLSELDVPHLARPLLRLDEFIKETGLNPGNNIFDAGKILTPWPGTDQKNQNTIQVNPSLALQWLLQILTLYVQIPKQTTSKAFDSNPHSIIGRNSEIADINRILSRSQKNNLLVMGKAGVGKSSIIRAFLDRLDMDDIPELDHMRLIEDIPSPLFQLKDSPIEVNHIWIIGDQEATININERLEYLSAQDDIRIIIEINQSSANTILSSSALRGKFDHIFVNPLPPECFLEIAKHKLSLLSLGEDKENVLAELAVSIAHDMDDRNPGLLVNIIEDAIWNMRGSIISEFDIRQAAARINGEIKLLDLPSIDKIREKLAIAGRGFEGASAAIASNLLVASKGLAPNSRPLGIHILSGPDGTGKMNIAHAMSSITNLPLIVVSPQLENSSIAFFSATSLTLENGLIEASSLKPSILLIRDPEHLDEDDRKTLLECLSIGHFYDHGGIAHKLDNVFILMTTRQSPDEISSGINSELSQITDYLHKWEGKSDQPTNDTFEAALQEFLLDTKRMGWQVEVTKQARDHIHSLCGNGTWRSSVSTIDRELRTHLARAIEKTGLTSGRMKIDCESKWITSKILK